MIIVLSSLLSIGATSTQKTTQGSQLSTPESETAETPEPSLTNTLMVQTAIQQQLQAAKKLRDSLTPDQVARIQAIVKRYESQLQQINSALPAPARSQSLTS